MAGRKQDDAGARYIDSKWKEGMPRADVAAPQEMSATHRDMAACSALPVTVLAENPFDIDDSATDPDGAALAKSVCGSCLVRKRCLEYAMEYEPSGIWGGLDAEERLARRGRPIVSYEERLEAARIRAMFAAGLTSRDVAERYGFSRRTVERWRKAAGLVVPRPTAA